MHCVVWTFWLRWKPWVRCVVYRNLETACRPMKTDLKVGFQPAIGNATDARHAMQIKKNPTYAMHAHKKRSERKYRIGCVCCVFCVCALHISGFWFPALTKHKQWGRNSLTSSKAAAASSCAQFKSGYLHSKIVTEFLTTKYMLSLPAVFCRSTNSNHMVIIRWTCDNHWLHSKSTPAHSTVHAILFYD